MNGPRLTRNADGSVIVHDLAPAFVHVLRELPSLLDPNQPDAVKARLFPLPTDDDEANEDWERLVHPDLFALLASARAIVIKDLASLGPADQDAMFADWELTIPARHVEAWLSALNAGRLTLGTLHDLDEAAMNEDEPPAEWTERQTAVAKVFVLGWIQQLILEDVSPTPEQPEEDDAGDDE